MGLFLYRAPYTATRALLSWLGSARPEPARRTTVGGGQRPSSARGLAAGRTRSAQRAMPITPTARRIAHAHNCCGPALSGGLLGFDSEGRGGAWYSGRSQPPAEIVYPVGLGRVSVRDVQSWLDERETVTARENRRRPTAKSAGVDRPAR